MIYQTLAPFYDLLVKDDEATQMWVDFTQKYAKGTNILELACGSGEITIALAKLGYSMYGTDLSQEMIDEAQEKEGSELVQWEALDMVQLPLDKKYDSILCYCDSLNYVVHDQDVLTVFEKVYACLEDDGVFLFDIHSLDREVEFAEEYIEEGFLDDVAYQWTIRHRWKLEECRVICERNGYSEMDDFHYRNKFLFSSFHCLSSDRARSFIVCNIPGQSIPVSGKERYWQEYA